MCRALVGMSGREWQGIRREFGRPRREIHPLAELAFLLLRHGIEDERYELAPSSTSTLAEALGQYFGSTQLDEAVRALIDVAAFFERVLRCPRAARAVLAAVPCWA